MSGHTAMSPEVPPRKPIEVFQSRPFLWTAQREQAAVLVAEDRLRHTEIARQVGITRRQLSRWSLHPSFSIRVGTLVREAAEALAARALFDQGQRQAAQADRWQRMQQVIQSRAADPLMAAAPGGPSGLMVRKPKFVKVYEEVRDEPAGDAGSRNLLELIAAAADPDRADVDLIFTKRTELVYEYAVDTGLLRELRELEKLAAQEAGQWPEKAGDSLSPDLVDAVGRIYAQAFNLANAHADPAERARAFVIEIERAFGGGYPQLGQPAVATRATTVAADVE